MEKIIREYLLAQGWVERAGIMVRFTNPRIGLKLDGTLILGWNEWPEKITTIKQLNKILDNMPTKIFTILGGDCPFDRKCARDSTQCRQCQYYYRAGTGTFFWCNHPIEQKPAEIAQKAPEIVQEKRKRGRPPGKAVKRPVKRRKTKK